MVKRVLMKVNQPYVTVLQSNKEIIKMDEVKLLVMLIYLGSFLAIFALADLVMWLYVTINRRIMNKRRMKQGLYLGTF